jgi:predicted metal-dependent phosphoesterase TrpH
MPNELAIIDLHTHSNRSDGRGNPSQVVAEAAEAGVSVLALTDHDTTSGWHEASEESLKLGLGFVPGIEVTTRAEVFDREGNAHRFSVHMLAYLPNPKDSALSQILTNSVSSRLTRLQEIVNRLQEDFDIDWSMVEEELADGKTAGRPAIADAMIRRQIISQRHEFFDFVHPGSKYYVPNRGVPETSAAIALIRAAGGVPIIAHPMARGKGPKPGEEMPLAHFEAMIEAGLAGFEVNHRDVAEHVRLWLLELARKHDLITTGSSDYHGTGKPNRLGENSTSIENLQRIVEQGRGAAPVNLPF